METYLSYIYGALILLCIIRPIRYCFASLLEYKDEEEEELEFYHPIFDDEPNIISIGTIEAYYGGLVIKKNILDDTHFWGIEDFHGIEWHSIPEELYEQLLSYERERRKKPNVTYNRNCDRTPHPFESLEHCSLCAKAPFEKARP